jgi:hypothetical protein
LETGDEGGRVVKNACSFLKKGTKKLLPVRMRAGSVLFASGDEGAGAKVFCFFFSKKKAFF